MTLVDTLMLDEIDFNSFIGVLREHGIAYEIEDEEYPDVIWLLVEPDAKVSVRCMVEIMQYHPEEIDLTEKGIRLWWD